MHWAFKSFPSILLCTILLFCSLCSLSFKYWSLLIEMTDQNLWFEKPLTHFLLPLPWGNSGHYAQRLVVLEESAPVRGDRKQRQAGFHGVKHPPSQPSPTFPSELHGSLWPRCGGTLHLGLCLTSGSLSTSRSNWLITMLCLVLGCFLLINFHVNLLSHISIVLSGCMPCVSSYLSKNMQLKMATVST